MTRLIDADEFRKQFSGEEHYWALKIMGMIDNAPTVEERPHGKWNVISLLRDYVYIRCSECGQSTRLVRDSKNEFCCIKDIRDKIVACPYCGAYMREADNDKIN